MQMLDRARWYMILALGAGLLVFWVPWQAVAICAVMVLFDWGFRRSHATMQQQPVPESNVGFGDLGPASQPACGLRTPDRIPVSLVRILGADCSLCRGIGCQTCAHTGLR